MQKQKFITTDKGFYVSLVRLALPIALQYLVSFLITLTNSISIGRLGKEATASAYTGTLIFTVLQMLITGVESGMTVASSRNFGERNNGKIKKITAIGTFLIFLLGAITSILSFFLPHLFISLFLGENSNSAAAEYLRIISFSFPLFCLSGALGASMKSIESPKITAAASGVAFLINLMLNYLLVFGNLGFSALGIKGSAIATLIARAAELSILLIYVFLVDKKLCLSVRSFLKFDRATSVEFLKYTAPLFLGQVIWIINTLFASYLLSALHSVEVVVGLAVANTLNSLAYILMNGTSSAVGIIIGKTIGENEIGKIKIYSYTTQIIFILLGIMTSISIFAVKNTFISIYSIGEDAQRIAKSLVSVLAVTAIGTSYQSACLTGLVKSGGDVSFVLKNDAFFVFLVVIPLSVISFRLGAPEWLIFLALKSDQLLKCIPAAIKINRFGWIKELNGKSKKIYQ